MKLTDSQDAPDPIPYWRLGETPEAVKTLLNGRLNRLHLHLLDVHDVRDLLELRCLRFTERLFGLMDVQCTGYISVEQLVNFIYAFESHHLQFRLYIILHCYDPLSRGYLTIPDIKTMFMENLVEGGREPNHRMVECLTESILGKINAEGPLVSYHQLMEVMMYHPHVLCHLTASKLPPRKKTDIWTEWWLTLKDVAMDYSGQVLSLMLCLFISMMTFTVSMVRYRDDAMTDILGQSHAIGRATSDLCKVAIVFFSLTLFNVIPFIYRKLSRVVHVRFVDIRIFRKLIVGLMLILAAVHSLCQMINMWQLTQTDNPDAWSGISSRSTRPSIGTFLMSHVFITGIFLSILLTTCILLMLTEDIKWPWHAPILTRMKAWYGNGMFKGLVLALLVMLIAMHCTTTFMRQRFRLPCLIWLWLGFPLLALAVDSLIFRLLDPSSQVEIVDYRILPKNGVLLTLTKPMDCRLGALSFVSIRFPGSAMSETRALAVLSHPSEDHLSVLIQSNDAWSRRLIHHFEQLELKSMHDPGHGDHVTVDVEETRNEEIGDQVSPNIHHRHPDRLTRLNTRVVYLTRTQRIGVIGDDPQLTTERRQIELSPGGHRRNSNFNVIFEITPASLSTEDSIRREEQRINSRQVTDEALMPNESPLLDDTSVSSVHVGLQTHLRGPYKLNNAFNEEKMLALLTYEVLFLVGHDFSSLPLIPLCSYILRRKTMAHRERNQSVTVRKVVLSWQLDRYEDVVWLMELLEPMHDLPSLIQLEVHVHVQVPSKMLTASKAFFESMEQIVAGPHRQKIPLDSRMVLYFGRRDCVYQLAMLRDDIHEGRVGIMVDGPHADRRMMGTWIQEHAEDRFHFLPLGIISI